MDAKEFKCVYDPVLAKIKKGNAPVYVKIKPGGGKASDPRLNLESRRGGRRKSPVSALPVPPLVIDSNWIGALPPTDLLITNLSPLTTVGQISAELQTLGKLEECSLVVHPDTAVSLGMCRVKFAGELGLAHQLASQLVAKLPTMRIGSDRPSALFDQDRSREHQLVRKLVEARNRELENLRRLERERMEKARQKPQQPAPAQVSASGLTARPTPQSGDREETYEQWIQRKIGSQDYVVVKTRLSNSRNCYNDLKDTLRGFSLRNILWFSQHGFHLTFDGPGRARRCVDQLDQTRLRRSGKPLYLSLCEYRRVDPMGDAVNQIIAELKMRLSEDVRRRVVLPVIFDALDPNKYAHIQRKTVSPPAAATVAATVGESTLSNGPKGKLASQPNGSGPAESNSGFDRVDFKKLHFRKRPGTSTTTPIKRRKLTLEELESDEERESDTGGDDDSMSDLPDVIKPLLPEVQMADVPVEPPIKSPEELEREKVTPAQVCFGKRPSALSPVPDRPLLLSELQTAVESAEDWQFLVAALGANPQPTEESWQKALVWSKLHMEKESIYKTQQTKPVGEIPLDMLVPKWTAPPPTAWRLRGYEPISSVLKSSYLPHRRRVRDPIDSVQRDSPHEAAHQHKSTDRHSRMASRRLAQNLNSQKQALSVETSILDMNQLLKRRKPVKFARSAIHNWGLYAVDKIEKNEMIIEYVGEVIRAPLADLRERNYVRSGIGSSYLFRIDGQTVIDATKRGGIARFINHSCDPSCTAKIIKVEGTKRIVIYALRDINANEELTYDYKFEREEGVDRIVCLCGAATCKGYLN